MPSVARQIVLLMANYSCTPRKLDSTFIVRCHLLWPASWEHLPKVSESYWFRTGEGSIETSRKKWSKSLSDLFDDAGVQNGHAHRFRDTFAVELLKAGTPIERVSIFLGHASVRITEKHYNPWNRARQEQAEADVKKSWTHDPIVLLEAKGTPGVLGTFGAVN